MALQHPLLGLMARLIWPCFLVCMKSTVAVVFLCVLTRVVLGQLSGL